MVIRSFRERSGSALSKHLGNGDKGTLGLGGHGEEDFSIEALPRLVLRESIHRVLRLGHWFHALHIKGLEIGDVLENRQKVIPSGIERILSKIEPGKGCDLGNVFKSRR